MDLSYYVDLVNQMLDDDRNRDDGYAAIDQAVNVEYDNPAELKALSWIGERKFPTTAFADASHAATRAFATRKPDLTIFAPVDDPEWYGMAEKMETAMEWELERLNRIGTKPVHWKVVESAVKYCAVAMQVEYLPFVFKGKEKRVRRVEDQGNGYGKVVKEKDPRIAAILRQSKFRWIMHHPASVHYRQSEGGLEIVFKAVQKSALELIDIFGADNPAIAALKAEYDKKDLYSQHITMYNYFDLYTWTDRVQWASEVAAEDTSIKAVPDGFVFRNEPHGLPFIPWVIVDNEDPIMLPAIQAGLYQNANILNTIAFSKAVDMAAHPELWIRTLDGSLSNVHIDNTNPSQPLVTDKTAEVTQLRPPVLDPQLMQMQQVAKDEVFRSSVSQILADIDRVGQQATFSTVSAMLEAAITQLSLAQNAAERAETLAVYQMFQWIDFTDIPLVAYRMEPKGTEEEGKQMGQELIIRPNYHGNDPKVATFDLDYLYLEMKLRSTSITDKQAELNNEIAKVERLGKSRRGGLESIGEKNIEADQDLRGQEDLFLATINAEVQRILQGPQMELMQAQEKAKAAQGAAAAQGGAPGGAGGAGMTPENAQNATRGMSQMMGEGMDTRGGGTAPPMGAGMNEQMTGQTRGGQGMA